MNVFLLLFSRAVCKILLITGSIRPEFPAIPTMHATGALPGVWSDMNKMISLRRRVLRLGDSADFNVNTETVLVTEISSKLSRCSAGCSDYQNYYQRQQPCSYAGKKFQQPLFVG